MPKSERPAGETPITDLLSPAVPGVDEDAPWDDEGVGLCLSGGGYRAMLFHLGSLWRLNEAGWLARLDRVSSVSGGSIAAGLLGHRWVGLQFSNGVAAGFVEGVVEPARRLARRTLDLGAVVTGSLMPGTIGARIAAAYRKHLFGTATLQSLPEHPRFVINATNVQTGSLWRFSKPYMADYQVGEVPNPTVELAHAVAASSAFPPFLSPLELNLDPGSFAPPGTGHPPLGRVPFTSRVLLTDGGVYDNLGLETCWKRCRTVLVSDGGGHLEAEERPRRNWAEHALRVQALIDNQVRSLRKRQLIGSYVHHRKRGAYWGVRTNIAHYALAEGQVLTAPHERTMELARTPTRLAAVSEAVQERLINWGYAVCDAALRKHVDPSLPVPRQLPYPRPI